jgi:hypothetical protein
MFLVAIKIHTICELQTQELVANHQDGLSWQQKAMPVSQVQSRRTYDEKTTTSYFAGGM